MAFKRYQNRPFFRRGVSAPKSISENLCVAFASRNKLDFDAKIATGGTNKPLTSEQEPIVRYMAQFRPGGYMAANSRAGVGKTTTAVVGMLRYAQDWAVKTFTGLGFHFLRVAWGTLELDKNGDKTKLLLAWRDLEKEPQALLFAKKIMANVQSNCIGLPTMENLMEHAETNDLVCDAKRQALGYTNERICQAVIDALQLAMVRPNDGKVSYGDMNWSAVAAGLVRPTFRKIVVDEYQDSNMLTNELIRLAMRENGDLTVFGDDFQAIYGWRGSIQTAMQKFTDDNKATVYGLAKTFRCGKKIVGKCNELVPDYYAHDSNHDGQVIAGMTEDNMLKTVRPGTDAILARLNAPLMPHCLKLIARGVPANVEGKDIGRDLLWKIGLIGGDTITSFLSCLEQWRSARQAKIGTGWNATERLARLQDDCDTLRVLAENCDTVSQMESKIDDLFTDAKDRRKPVVVLSTVHKAKGLEWDNVSILQQSFMSNRTLSPEQQREERNVKYVAWTRPKNELRFVS